MDNPDTQTVRFDLVDILQYSFHANEVVVFRHAMRNVKFLKSLSGKDFAAYLISFHFGLVFHALAQKTCKSHVYNAMQARCEDSHHL